VDDADKTFVEFNGTKVISWWPEHMARSQRQLTCKIGGVDHLRIRFGSESDDWGADRGPCHDCAALKGQLHGFGCDVERCPACDGQLINCDCDVEDPPG